MKTVKPQDLCCGCGACAPVCPVQAITMQPDACGYVYPVIDEDRCIGCGKCEKLCAFADRTLQKPVLEAYAAVGADRALQEKSASGGVFAALAQACLQNGGMAAGAVLDASGPLQVYHVVSDRPEMLAKMQGSKYVQSDLTGCYEPLQQALKSGRTVFFCGTPCQVAAVKRLTGDPEQLITADLICHGVPSGKMLADFGQCLQKRFFGKKLTGLCFRDKSTEKSFCARLEFGKKQVLQRSHSLSYYDAFLRGASYRESCYSCPYACTDRPGDLTLGDYWGVEKTGLTLPPEKHWSCLLVSTEKGRRFLRQWDGALRRYPTGLADVCAQNRQLTAPSQPAPDRQALLQTYARNGYGAVEKEFVKKQGGSLRVWLRAVKSWMKP